MINVINDTDCLVQIRDSIQLLANSNLDIINGRGDHSTIQTWISETAPHIIGL